MSITKDIHESEYFDCVAHSCKKKAGCSEKMTRDGTSFSLKGTATPHLLLDCDKLPTARNASRCDFIFFADGSEDRLEVASPIEMTSGKKDVSKAVEQLKAGARIIMNVSSRSSKFLFVPVLVGQLRAKRRRDIKAWRKDMDRRISFHGRKYLIHLVPNGGELSNALNILQGP